jgi:hypothetical protein
MIWLLAMAVAVAGEPPATPGPRPVTPGECAEAVAVVVGQPVTSPATCSGVLEPTSWAYECEDQRLYASTVAGLYRTDTNALELELEQQRARADAAERAAVVPWYDRPPVARAEGAVGVAVVVVAAAVVAVEVR